MKKIVAFAFAAMLSAPFVTSAEEVPAAVHDQAKIITAWGTDPVLVDAVKAQNAKGLSLDDIKSADAAWMATDGVNDVMKSMLENPAAKHLYTMEKSKNYYTESFLMDNQGANVAMTNKTSDYWQGDEPKFTESFAGGKGAVHIGAVKFDESAQAYLVQISVPVMDEGKAIGAITVGVNLDEMDKGN